MRVWFVTQNEQPIENYEEGATYEYDTFIDSKLFATEALAQAEVSRKYNASLTAETENYERRVARWQARQDAKAILGEEKWNAAFPYEGENEFPKFYVPKRQYIYWLDIVQ